MIKSQNLLVVSNGDGGSDGVNLCDSSITPMS